MIGATQVRAIQSQTQVRSDVFRTFIIALCCYNPLALSQPTSHFLHYKTHCPYLGRLAKSTTWHKIVLRSGWIRIFFLLLKSDRIQKQRHYIKLLLSVMST